VTLNGGSHVSQTSSRRDSCLASRCSQCHEPASPSLLTVSLTPAAAADDDDVDSVVSTKAFSNRAKSFKYTHNVSKQKLSTLASINEVNLRPARLVLRWETVSGFNSRYRTLIFRYVTNQPPKANSAFHPSGVGK